MGKMDMIDKDMVGNMTLVYLYPPAVSLAAEREGGVRLLQNASFLWF